MLAEPFGKSMKIMLVMTNYIKIMLAQSAKAYTQISLCLTLIGRMKRDIRFAGREGSMPEIGLIGSTLQNVCTHTSS